MKDNKQLPKVSFIIPTLNAERFLPLCLSAIREQDYPKDKIEIIVADAGSKDKTLLIAKKFKAKIITNPEVLHEPGKTRASKLATGEILFFTDADNILAHKNWLKLMTKPYIDDPKIMGFLPQTIPAPNSNSLDQYLGYLATDPFTWFIYGPSASPRDYPKVYTPVRETPNYKIYKFSAKNHPLFGLSQGVGTRSDFKRGKTGHSDDILAGIKLIAEGGLIAYVPKAGIYHYHVSGLKNFIKKYSWRIKNNLKQEIKGMGLVNRQKYFSKTRKIKMFLFIPYALSIVLPTIDALKLTIKYKDLVMLWHLPTSFILALLILYETLKHLLCRKTTLGAYE